MKKEQFLGNDFEITLQRSVPPTPQYTAFIIASDPFFLSIIGIFQNSLQAISQPYLNYFLGNLNWI